jgi:hypothetical protein
MRKNKEMMKKSTKFKKNGRVRSGGRRRLSDSALGPASRFSYEPVFGGENVLGWDYVWAPDPAREPVSVFL